MKSIEKLQIFDGTGLKIMAMVFMVLDHVGDNFFPEQTWMRALGRIAMPIFAFCVAEGLCHTRDKMKYLRRMLIFGLISEVPFDLVTSGKVLEFSHQNIMFTFSWAIIGMICCDWVMTRIKNRSRYLFAGLTVLFFLGSSVILGLDYNFLAVSLIAVYYLLRGKAMRIRNAAAAAVHGS